MHRVIAECSQIADPNLSGNKQIFISFVRVPDGVVCKGDHMHDFKMEPLVIFIIFVEQQMHFFDHITQSRAYIPQLFSGVQFEVDRL